MQIGEYFPNEFVFIKKSENKWIECSTSAFLKVYGIKWDILVRWNAHIVY